MHIHDTSRIDVGTRLVAAWTVPAYYPLIVLRLQWDSSRRHCLVHVRLRAADDPDARGAFLSSELDWPPMAASWDDTRCCWVDRRSGRQVLPRP